MIRIGASGNSTEFYDEGNLHTYQAGEWLNKRGLNAFEYSFGRGVKMSVDTATKIRAEFEKYDIEISSHAPYYTNFANPDEEMIQKSMEYVRQTILAENMLGGKRSVFHPASCGTAPRAEAVARAKQNIERLMEVLSEISFEFILCPETMGKLSQIGTVEEVLDFCTIDKRLYPCFDFGHINSYSQGGLKGYDDYKRIIDLTADKLDDERAKNFHVHFSKIMYSAKGEIKHLTFEDETFGPDYAPLAKVIDDYGLTPFIVCESSGTQSKDASIMKNMHKSFNK